MAQAKSVIVALDAENEGKGATDGLADPLTKASFDVQLCSPQQGH
jgi:hypothetical protein